MAAGVPVVAPANDGIPDVVKHEHTGLAVPVRDPDALAAAVLRLHAEPDLVKKLVPAARALFEQEFSIEAAGRAYEALYLELLEKAKIEIPPARQPRASETSPAAQV
jgi:glycosyltransferase involved in cell wall biosynthesis